MRLRDRFDVSTATQGRLTYVMQLILVVILVAGILRGSPGTVVNAGAALGITWLPAVLERDYNIPLDAGLTLWITTAVFLHAVGALGPYRSVWWWDHVTHTLSASIVGGAGYTVVRAFDEHSTEVHVPGEFTFVFVLLFVLAFGVYWEVLEYLLGVVTESFGSAKILTQYGLEDTMMDLVFDAAGGVIVATWGTVHLTDVVGAVTEWFAE